MGKGSRTRKRHVSLEEYEENLASIDWTNDKCMHERGYKYNGDCNCKKCGGKDDKEEKVVS